MADSNGVRKTKLRSRGRKAGVLTSNDNSAVGGMIAKALGDSFVPGAKTTRLVDARSHVAEKQKSDKARAEALAEMRALAEKWQAEIDADEKKKKKK